MTAPHVHPGVARRRQNSPSLSFYACLASAIWAGMILVAPAYAQDSSSQSKAAAESKSTAQPGSKPQRPVGSSFDVVSIHSNNLDRTGHSHIYYSLSDSSFRCMNVTGLQLVEWAWELPDSRILGAPQWVTSTHFDVEAKSDTAADDYFHALPVLEARREKDKMVQALLADRFHLASH